MGQGKAYEKVIDYIQGEMLKGELKRGEKRPPERELAELLGVGRNSVREAMRTLSLMGFISSTQGAGNFVSCNLEKNLAESTRMMMMLGRSASCGRAWRVRPSCWLPSASPRRSFPGWSRSPGRCGGPEWS